MTVGIIPPKSNRRFPAEFDRHTYKWRHLVENFFGKLKEYRGIAMRSCKTDDSFKIMSLHAKWRINVRFPADRHTYKWRHLVENFFGKLKEYRGIAMRSCKTDDSFKAFISLAAIVIQTR